MKKTAVLFDIISNRDHSLRFRKIGILKRDQEITEEKIKLLREKAGIEIKLLINFEYHLEPDIRSLKEKGILSQFIEKYPGGHLQGENYYWEEGMESIGRAPLERITAHYPKNYESLNLAFTHYFSNL